MTIAWRILLAVTLVVVFPHKALAAVTDLTISGAPPNSTFTLINEKTNQTEEGKSDSRGTVTFKIDSWKLPAGSDVRLTGKGLPAGGSVISSLNDGSNTRDFNSLAQGAGPPGWGLNFSFQPRVQWNTVPQVGIGTSFPVGTPFGQERFLLKSPNWGVGFSPHVTAGLNLGKQPLEIGFNYFSASAKNSASEPIGGNNVAITFHKMYMGSTGIFLGMTGMDGNIDADKSAFEFSLGAPGLLYSHKGMNYEFSVGPRVFVGYNKTSYDGTVRSLSFPEIFSKTDQDVKQTYGGFGLSLQKSHQLPFDLQFSGGINLDAVYNSARYNGTQKTFCDLCPLQLQAVRINTSDSQYNWSFRPSVYAGLNYPFKNWSVGANAYYQWNSAIAGLTNPPNPQKDVPPSLGTQSAHEVGFGVKIVYKFQVAP